MEWNGMARAGRLDQLSSTQIHQLPRPFLMVSHAYLSKNWHETEGKERKGKEWNGKEHVHVH